MPAFSLADCLRTALHLTVSIRGIRATRWSPSSTVVVQRLIERLLIKARVRIAKGALDKVLEETLCLRREGES